MTDLSPRLAALSPEQRAHLARLLRERAQREQTATIPRRSPHTDTAPCSWMQRGLWLLDQLQPGPAYSLVASTRLRGRLDVPTLERALNEVIRRHEVLRTTFQAEDGEPVQRIVPELYLPIVLVDLSTAPAEERDVALESRTRRVVQRPFDLARGPLVRATLFQLRDDEWRFILTLHHSICDEWSMGLLAQEIQTLYAAFQEGRPSPLPELPIQYADYAVWQRSAQHTAARERDLSYWKQQLAGAAPTELPTDFPRPATQRFRGARIPFRVPASTVERLTALGRLERATLYMVLVAGFQTLLHRYTGQDDVVIGSVIADRRQSQTHPSIGFFLNTLVTRTDLSGDPGFRELLRRVRRVALDGYEHQDAPFDQLVNALLPARDQSRNPLFQIMFNLQEGPPGDLSFAGVQAEPEFVETGSVQFDLNLILEQGPDGFDGQLQYDSDLFERATIERMAEHLTALLEGIAADPERRLSELPLLSDAERRLVVETWNQTGAPFPADATIPSLFEQQVARTPEAVAVDFEGQHLTYRDLDGRSTQLAHHLRTLGVGPDTLVGICAERSLELVVGLLGILKAGGAYVPLDPAYPSERLAFMLADAQVGVLLTQQDLVERLPPSQARIVCLDADWSTVAACPTTAVRSGVEARHLAYMIYTSGSTGQPKGALNTHRAIVNRLLWMQEVYGLNSHDRVLQKTPSSFDVSVWEFFWPLLNGARLVVARPEGHRDPSYLRSLIRAQGITTLHFVPSMLQAFLAEPELAACTSLRRIICSGEALSTQLRDRCFARLSDVELHNLYGPTEAAVDVTAWACQPDGHERTVPIGRPIANTRVYVLDPHGQPTPIGVPGELYIGGVQVGCGYLNRPQLTAERFVPDRFSTDPTARLYRTGDLVRWRADGVLEFLGRLDQQVKLRGFRIELGEIEATLGLHPSVAEAAVVVREDRADDPRLVAYLVPDRELPSALELRAFVAQRLPEYMLPAAFVTLDALPL
ncbi:MAG: amino acid adenylation domain-containing protein, partial [Chloroflexi bacterium]|nr:amino acid adenylation domain-containing protein [Chloroflexota bacterium]